MTRPPFALELQGTASSRGRAPAAGGVSTPQGVDLAARGGSGSHRGSRRWLQGVSNFQCPKGSTIKRPPKGFGWGGVPSDPPGDHKRGIMRPGGFQIPRGGQMGESNGLSALV
eukprot:1134257-Prorocentrum_minimum.AAC.4